MFILVNTNRNEQRFELLSMNDPVQILHNHFSFLN
jgi:hypothetical protein